MAMESGDEKKPEQRQPPALPPKKRRKKPKPEKPALANGGSSSSAAESCLLSRTSSSSPPSGDADGNKGQQQQQAQQQLHEQGGGGGKRPRLVWTNELHDLFVKAYDGLGDEAVPRRILEKMNEKMNVPELSREKVASHLQKHKLHLKRLAEEASSHSRPTEEAPAASHHPLRRSLAPNTPLAKVSQAQLELVQQVLQDEPPDSLSRSGSNIAANLHIVQSIQQQFLGPPIKEGPAETMQMQRAPADSDFSPLGMETSTAAFLVPEAANTEEAVIRMVQAANAGNAAEPEEAAPAAGSILGQFWASPDNEASCTSSWDIFGPESR